MIKWLRRLFLSAVILTLLITNVLSITSTAFNGVLAGITTTTLGLTTATGALRRRAATQRARNVLLENQAKRQRSAVHRMGQRLTNRTKRIAAYSVAEIPASILPYAGMAILVTGTAWELKQLCQGLYELEELYSEIELEEEVDSDVLEKVCHPSSWLSSKASVQQ